MNALARIVLGQPVSEVGRVATIAQHRKSDALASLSIAHRFLFNPGALVWKVPNDLSFRSSERRDLQAVLR